MDYAPPPRRHRRGSLERPVSTRIYRAAWIVVAVPLIVAAFIVDRAEPLAEPSLPPTFDQASAVQFATELAQNYPDRSAGSDGARDATGWVAARLKEYRLATEQRPFSTEVPGLGEQRFVNLVTVVPGLSPRAIVVLAHRDNLGRSPGANDNASGTAALLELARNVASVQTGSGARRLRLAHTLVFVSADGGVHGNVGALEFARDPAYAERVVAVLNLDALAGSGGPRLAFAGETARSPSAALLATAERSVATHAGAEPGHPNALSQLIDLALPFSLYGHAPFVAHGVPAVTLTTAGDRPPSPDDDTVDALVPGRLGALGRSAQALMASLDQSADVATGTDSYVYFGPRLIRGWVIKFILLCALLPFLAATLDLFARCRRRHIRLAPALRSYLSRLGVWLWAGALFSLLALAGILPQGDARPINPETSAAQDWPVLALVALLGLSVVGWLVARPRLVPRRGPERREDLGGHLAAMLALAIVALVVAATNPYSLVFVLPSLHAWLWLPHVADRGLAERLGLYALGFAGPLLLVGSFAIRLDLGLDAAWYVLALTAVGLVPLPLAVSFLAWGAAAGQVGALAAGRYAPYPDAAERPARGPIRETLRQTVLLVRRRRAEARPRPAESEPRSLEEQ